MKMKSLLVICTIFSFFLLTDALAQDYNFETIDVPDSNQTFAYGINNSGQIVGFYNHSTGSPPGPNGSGFLLSNGIFTTIDYPGVMWPQGTILTGINNSGQIVGHYGYGESGKGFLFSGGTFTDIHPPDAVKSLASGINNLGEIVGEAWYGVNNAWIIRGFLFKDGTFTYIDAPGFKWTHPNGINDAGQIVGAGTFETNYSRGFLLSGGIFTDIFVPGSIVTSASAINNAGEIVGNYTISSGSYGFVFGGNTFSTVDVTGYRTVARGINDSGQVVGQFEGYHPDVWGFVATPIPTTITVTINIRPQGDANRINLRKNEQVKVAILSTPDFDAVSQVDQTSLTFGATGDEQSLVSCKPKPKDINHDGVKDDLVCNFSVPLAGFQCGDTEGILKGLTIDGKLIEGKDLVNIVKCK